MRLKAPARCRALLLALALLPPLASGCATTRVSRSQIEQGQAITTGKEPFDAFFQAVRTVREEALKAEDDAAGARAGATRMLGLSSTASAGEAIAAARARAAKLREAGVTLHLDLTPEPRLVSASGKVKIDASVRTVLDALEESAKGSLAVSRKLDELAARASELQKQRRALEAESPSAFTDAKRRDEVKREIAAAERVLAEAADQSSKQAALASKFALDLAQAVETGAGAGDARRPASSRPAAAKPAPGGRKPPPSGARPAAPPPPPRPKPSGGGDDFEP
ncbi:MAG: hypothetical protein IT372_25365 [Polyangiaceae bacterium]|nr:hypothetical protein [Polyangiaceae bacterium]